MQPFQPNPYDDASPYGEAIPFVDYKPPKETTSVPAGSETPTSAASPAAPSLPVAPTQPPSTHSKRSPIIASMLVVLVFVVIAGSGITWYATGPHTAELNAQATAVVENIQHMQTQTTLQATATVNAMPPDLYYSTTTRGQPNILDPLNDPAASTWPAFSIAGTSCIFSENAFHAKTGTGDPAALCPDAMSQLSNFIFQVNMTVIHTGSGGLFFRSNYGSGASTFTGYLFLITHLGGYALFAYKADGTIETLISGSTLAYVAGQNESNMIAVVARGNNLSFFINRQFVDKVSDATFSQGTIGLAAANETKTGSANIAFNNAEIWIP